MKTIWLGMSGGVDSSAAAWLLKQQGYTVVGITLRLHGQADRDCADARRVCDKLGMEHRILDGRERFRDIVVSRFIADYYAGRTPNPCVVCNRRIKFGWMLDEALRNGADGIATGHYANAAFDPASGRWQLRCSHSGKDQSYMLYGLSQEQLAHTLFPLQDREKEEVRRLAKEAGLSVADKGDSMEICFVPGDDYIAFLEAEAGQPMRPGNFVDENGRVLGRHAGLPRYTVGQRKGLGISFGRPMYVVALDASRNEVVLGEEGRQMASVLYADEVNFLSVERPRAAIAVQAKIRYQAPPAQAVLTPLDDGRVRVDFARPQRSITPGQAVVFYDGDLVLGGGTICGGTQSA